MNNYKIFKSTSDTYEAVKQGWSWPAFFFVIFWLLIKRLWVVAIILFIIMLPIVAYFMPDLQHATDQQIKEASDMMNRIGLIVETPIRFILAFYGNKLREQNLIKRNYVLVGNITAESPAKAIEQYLKGNKSFLEM